MRQAVPYAERALAQRSIAVLVGLRGFGRQQPRGAEWEAPSLKSELVIDVLSWLLAVALLGALIGEVLPLIHR